MNIPEDAINIIEKLNAGGYEAYLVGGCVRDMVMGKEPKDWDITTSATPYEVKALFNKTFDTGIEHGTVTVVLNKENYEVTTYRIDGEYKDFRRPEEVLFTKRLKEDLLRRDFTMNAIVWHPKDGFIDYFGGMEDIENKIIRGVGEPHLRFNEDALRMLRAVRFACRLGFDIEEKTFTALKNNSGLIKHVSMERIRDELLKTFTAEQCERAEYFLECNLLFDALNFMADYVRGNIEEFIRLLRNMKPENRSETNVLALFFRNMEQGRIGDCLKKLRLDKACIKAVGQIAPLVYTKIEPDNYEVKKILCALGYENYFSLLNVKEAAGEQTEMLEKTACEIAEKNEPIFIKDLNIDGDILKEKLDITGRLTGDLLKFLQHEVMKEPEKNELSKLLKLAENYKAENPHI